MNTLDALTKGQAARATNQPTKVFDWKKAAMLIKEHNIKDAEAGLVEDYEWTAGPILRNGKIVPRNDTYTYLASCWATPTLFANSEEFECWTYKESSEYNSETYWPEDALAILNS